MNEAGVVFWLLAVLLLLMAVAFITLPLLRRRSLDSTDANQQNILIAKEHIKELEADFQAGKISEETYQQSRAEVERALLNDVSKANIEMSTDNSPVMVFSVALLVPIMAIIIYLNLGTPVEDVITAKKSAATNALAGNGDHNVQNVEVLAQKLAAKLQEQPNDANGWVLLGRTYQIMKNYTLSANAFGRAHALQPNDVNTMLRYADSLIMAQQGQISGKPAELINKALSISPNDLTALWLAGMAAEQEGRYQQALDHWNKIVPQIQSSPESLSQLQALIARVSAKLPSQSASTGTQTAPLAGSTSNPAAHQITLLVKVDLDPAIRQKVTPETAVFIYAKANQGPPMPLAAVQRKVKDLPLTIQLDDSMAMMSGMTLSNFNSYKVGARISTSGNAIAQSGDYFAEVNNIVPTSNQPVLILINQIKP